MPNRIPDRQRAPSEALLPKSAILRREGGVPVLGEFTMMEYYCSPVFFLLIIGGAPRSRVIAPGLALTLYSKRRIIGTPKIERKRDPQQLAAPAPPDAA